MALRYFLMFSRQHGHMSSPTKSKRRLPNERLVTVAPANGKSRFIGNLSAICAGLGLGLVLSLELRGLKIADLSQTGPLLIFIGRITAMVGTYGVLLTLLLIARIPLLEREVGLDRTVTWHRKLAPWAMLLIAIHVVTTVLGYSITANSSALSEFWSLVTTTRWILPATAGFLLMLTASVTSYKKIRTKIAYETWWVIHVYTYLAIALSYAHQVTLGNALVKSPTAAKAWLVATVVSVGCIVVFRWLMPIVRGVRYQLRVHAVVRESSNVVSVWMTGRKLDRLRVRGGQFFAWRFLTRELWWHAHPYSLSAAPDGQYLRITVKDLGDHSNSLASLRPGTRVIAEGPYGAFTAAHRHGDDVVLIAAGVGIAPIRSLMEELPQKAKVTVLFRARSHDEVLLKRELDILADRPNTTVRYLVGSRKEHPMDARTLLRLVPTIADADIYVCGPDVLTQQIRQAAEVLGIPATHIHDEAFAF